jgi:hypothetical protein
MPVAGESGAASRSSAVATVDAGSSCLARPELSSARGSNGDFYRASMADVLRPWYPQLLNRGPIGWSRRRRTSLRGTDGSNRLSATGESIANFPAAGGSFVGETGGSERRYSAVPIGSPTRVSHLCAVLSAAAVRPSPAGRQRGDHLLTKSQPDKVCFGEPSDAGYAPAVD